MVWDQRGQPPKESFFFSAFAGPVPTYSKNGRITGRASVSLGERALHWESGRLARSDGRCKTFLSRGRDAHAPSTPAPPGVGSSAATSGRLSPTRNWQVFGICRYLFLFQHIHAANDVDIGNHEMAQYNRNRRELRFFKPQQARDKRESAHSRSKTRASRTTRRTP